MEKEKQTFVVGQKIITGTKKFMAKVGHIRYLGEIKGLKGIWYGVELLVSAFYMYCGLFEET